jgi:hypothetical protein
MVSPKNNTKKAKPIKGSLMMKEIEKEQEFINHRKDLSIWGSGLKIYIMGKEF